MTNVNRQEIQLDVEYECGGGGGSLVRLDLKKNIFIFASHSWKYEKSFVSWWNKFHIQRRIYSYYIKISMSWYKYFGIPFIPFGLFHSL